MPMQGPGPGPNQPPNMPSGSMNMPPSSHGSMGGYNHTVPSSQGMPAQNQMNMTQGQPIGNYGPRPNMNMQPNQGSAYYYYFYCCYYYVTLFVAVPAEFQAALGFLTLFLVLKGPWCTSSHPPNSTVCPLVVLHSTIKDSRTRSAWWARLTKATTS